MRRGIKDWPKDVPAGSSGKGNKKFNLIAWGLLAAPVATMGGVVAVLLHGYGVL